MKKKIMIILGLLVAIVLVGFSVYYFVFRKNDNKNIGEEKVYNCLYMVSGDEFNNTSLETYNYDLKVINDVVVESDITVEQHYKDYDSFYENYSRLNTDDKSKGEIVAYDFDKYLLVFKKIERPNVNYNNYLNSNNLNNLSCSIKEEKESVAPSENKTDIKHLCSKDSSVYLFTVDENDNITSVKNGTKHIMNSVEEFEQRVNVLKDNEFVSYIYDIDNLTITQLNVFKLRSPSTYSDYVLKNLNDYDCEIME